MEEYNEIYTRKNLATFSIDIGQKKHPSGKWKKRMVFPQGWTSFTINDTIMDDKHNGLAMLTGRVNNIIVIDIDNVQHWNTFLKEHKQKEPNTVKAISGSGGIHYYFLFEEELRGLKSLDHCFGKDYDIDIKTNGGCIIVPPSSYYNKNLKKNVSYVWETSIIDKQPTKMPEWMKKILIDRFLTNTTPQVNDIIKKVRQAKIVRVPKKDEPEIIEPEKIKPEKTNLKKAKIKKSTVKSSENSRQNEKQPEDDTNDFSTIEIEKIVDMLDVSRADNYTDWLNVGLCLHNINKEYYQIWDKWSQRSPKYEKNVCKKYWDKFKGDTNGLKIGSLILWAKKDNPEKLDTLMKNKKLNKLIISKYPNDNLIIGETTKVNDINYYTCLKNKNCFIKGSEHHDMPHSMYIDMLDHFMAIKCRHHECYGKTYPCQHILMTKNEYNLTLHGNVNITIQESNIDNIFEYPKFNIFSDNALNELVYIGLTGQVGKHALIMYHLYSNDYVYSMNNEWYHYENHRWNFLGPKNTKLRYEIQSKLEEIYGKVEKYYKENNENNNKILAVRRLAISFSATLVKNNIMNELIELFSNNCTRRDEFLNKLDSNGYLLGFENGIYDFKTMKFRDGKRDDFISLSVKYDYINKHTDKYNDLLKFLEDIQPTIDDREYTLTYLSTILVSNELQLFTILTGNGRNGKSKFISLLKLVFGEYYEPVASQLFTRPCPNMQSPDPGLLSLAKKKLVIASEPEQNGKLNTSFIKFITGKDSTKLRKCHSNEMVEFTPFFSTMLVCNDIPDCDAIDQAIVNRLRCIHFPTEFVDVPVKDNQKKIIINIADNFDDWKTDFMLMLIERYKTYSVNRVLKTTKNILKWTLQYRENIDIYLQFLNDHTCASDTENIHCSTLYNLFKKVFRENDPNGKIPSNKEFVSNVRKHHDIKKIAIDGKILLGIKRLTLKEP